MKFKSDERILKANDAEKPKQQQGCTRFQSGVGRLGLELQAGKIMLGLMGDKKFKEIDYK